MMPILLRLATALAALALSASVPLRAQNEPSPPAVPMGPALWMIGDEDTKIYLFGTIHALPDGVDWFRGNVASAFAASDTLVTEVAAKEDPAMQATVLKLAALPEGASLRGQMSAEQRAAYDKALVAFNIPPAMLDRFEPWYAAIALSTLPLMQQGFSPANGVDSALQAKASVRKMSQVGLESAEYQLGLFDGLPAKAQQRYLGEVIEQLPNLREQMGAILSAWKTGDADELARLMNFAEDDPAFSEIMLTGRNRHWAEWLDERLDQPGTVFVAVGAGHLAGTGSVQDQLAARGIGAARVQ
jgi:uncharacterized protein YbaP (TraB family)